MHALNIIDRHLSLPFKKCLLGFVIPAAVTDLLMTYHKVLQIVPYFVDVHGCDVGLTYIIVTAECPTSKV